MAIQRNKLFISLPFFFFLVLLFRIRVFRTYPCKAALFFIPADDKLDSISEPMSRREQMRCG